MIKPAPLIEGTRIPVACVKHWEARYIPEPNSGCWLWLGRESGGYGYVRGPHPRRAEFPATHVALASIGVSVPSGLLACHKCDVPLCVNPDHLFVGTPSDNQMDAVRKGRRGAPSYMIQFRCEQCGRGYEKSTNKVSRARGHRSRFCSYRCSGLHNLVTRRNPSVEIPKSSPTVVSTTPSLPSRAVEMPPAVGLDTLRRAPAGEGA